MAAFTYLLRRTKGTPLTNDQVDDNFEHLRVDLIGGITYTNSAQLAALLSDETGTGYVVYSDSPTITNAINSTSITFNLLNTTVTTLNFAGAATTLIIGALTGTTTINNTLHVLGDIVAFYTSDLRLKTNVQRISDALLKVCKLRGVTWDWKDDVSDEIKSTPTTGIIAQEVEEVLPQVVIERANGTKAVSYDRLIGLLVEAIKELNDKVDVLSKELEFEKTANKRLG